MNHDLILIMMNASNTRWKEEVLGEEEAGDQSKENQIGIQVRTFSYVFTGSMIFRRRTVRRRDSSP